MRLLSAKDPTILSKLEQNCLSGQICGKRVFGNTPGAIACSIEENADEDEAARRVREGCSGGEPRNEPDWHRRDQGN
jgi:hypothetical protein